MKNLQKITFFVVLAISLILVISQLVEYYPKDVLITVVDSSWAENAKTLGLYALGLVVKFLTPGVITQLAFWCLWRHGQFLSKGSR